MPKLVLVPSFLGDKNYDNHFPADNLKVVDKIKVFFVEDIRTARRFLSAIKVSTPIHDLIFDQFDKKTSKGIYGKATPEETAELLEEGIDVATIPWPNKSEN